MNADEAERFPLEEQKQIGIHPHKSGKKEEVSEEFKRLADKVFKTNEELFKKLAQ